MVKKVASYVESEGEYIVVISYGQFVFRFAFDYKRDYVKLRRLSVKRKWAILIRETSAVMKRISRYPVRARLPALSSLVRLIFF